MDASLSLYLSLAAATLLLLFYHLKPILDHLICVYRLNLLNLPGLGGDAFTGIGIPMFLLNKQKDIPPNVRPMFGVTGMCNKIFKNDAIIHLKVGVWAAVAMLCKAESAEVLLSDNKEVKKAKEYLFVETVLGQGLITSEPTIWRRHRKLLTPTFHFRILDGFQPIMNENGNTLVEILKNRSKDGPVNVEIPVTMCTLDIISETALGIKLGAQFDGNSDYVQSIFRSTALVTHRMLSPWLWPSLLFWLSPSGIELRRHLNVMNNFIKKLIAKRKVELEAEFFNMSPEELEEAIPKKSRPFLDTLLLHNISQPNNKLTEQEILDEVRTFTFTAHDTVAMATYWVMYYLGLDEEIQKKAQKEIDAVFQGDQNRIITLDDVKTLGYLERCIKESQRLTPAVPCILRQLQEDMNINGVVLPKGTTAAVMLYCIHRDESVYPNPEVFDPDRFLDTKQHPFAFIPFSAGPRSCLGQRYAGLCMKTVMANLLRNLSWKSLDPQDKVLFNPEFAIRPSIPLRLEIQIRDSSDT